MRRSRGFTLIELLLSIAIMSVLSSVVLQAVNPARQIGKALDAGREQHARVILDAVTVYSLDHQGFLPSQLPTSARVIGSCQSASCPEKLAAEGESCVALDLPADQPEGDFVPAYLAAIPRDQDEGNPDATGFYIYRYIPTNAVVIGACYARTRPVELRR